MSLQSLLLLLGLWVLSPFFAYSAPIPVKVYLVEALSPHDSNSSEIFTRKFESTLEIAKEQTTSALLKCGYNLQFKFLPFEANDPLQVYEHAQAAEKEGAWLIIGPRRSNHYLLSIRGAPNTPSVSTMAASTEIDKEGPLHLSVYPRNSDLAVGAVHASLNTFQDLKDKSYFTILNEDCVMCRDFSIHYDSFAKTKGLKKLGQLSIHGENPEIEPILSAVQTSKPNLILLPNYSKASAIVMGTIHAKFPTIRFIGGDGWGDNEVGYVKLNPAVENAYGVCTRGFPPAALGMREFPLGKKVLAIQSDPSFPSGTPGVALLRIFQGLEDLLCEKRPTQLSNFKSAFLQTGSRVFRRSKKVSVYNSLENEVPENPYTD